MARNKYPELTRQKILDSAIRLFAENGWNETTIQDIVDDVGGLTRGAFYHHFKSKDDIIDAVTTEMFLENNPFEISQKIQGVNALEKLKNVVLLFFQDENQIRLVRSVPYMLKTPEFVSRQVMEAIQIVAPNIEPFISEGIEDGSIKAKYPNEAAQTFSLLVNIWLNPIFFESYKEEYIKKVEHFGLLMEGIGIPLLDDKVKKILLEYYDKVSSKE